MELHLATIDGDITRITLCGRFDVLAAETADSQFSAIFASNRPVIIDLEQVPMIGSMAIRTLVRGARTMKSKGAKMALLNPTADVKTILEETGADTIIPVVSTLEAAVAAVTG